MLQSLQAHFKVTTRSFFNVTILFYLVTNVTRCNKSNNSEKENVTINIRLMILIISHLILKNDFVTFVTLKIFPDENLYSKPQQHE